MNKIMDIIVVSKNIPDKNLFILKSIYPNARIVKEIKEGEYE